MSATTTQSVTVVFPPRCNDVELELQQFGEGQPKAVPDRTVQASPPDARPPTSLPTLKLLVGGFSFFCAGVNDGTLGALIPYILSTFSIGTGEVSITYATTFAGWLLALATNPLLATYLTLGQLLALGAVLQLVAQCLRPWSPLPLYCITFFIQALGMALQDAHTNTFVSSVHVAHRWLGFIHAMYALGCLIGPLIATSIAAHGAAVATVQESSAASGRSDDWRKVYYVLVGLGVINAAGVAIGFRDTVWTYRNNKHGGSDSQASHEETEAVGKGKVAVQELLEMLKVKSVWIISLFYFFYLGAGMTSGGWVVEFLTTVRRGDIFKMGYVPTGNYAGVFLGRLLLAEPTHRFGERRMIIFYSLILVALQLVFWLVPNIVANAVALSIMGFFSGPFFATGVSVASKIFPRKIQAAALSFVFVIAQAGGAIFPSITGAIATQHGVQVLQPIVLTLIILAAICWWLIPKAPATGESDRSE